MYTINMSIFNFTFISVQSQCLPISSTRSKLQGFLLLEALVSLLILMIVSTALSSWYISLIDQQKQAFNRLKAVTIASSLLESVLAYKKIPAYHDSFYTATWKTTTHEYTKFYTVTLEWQEQHAKRHVELATGVAL